MILTFLSLIYLLAVAGLSLYGLLGLLTLWLYQRHRHETFPCPPPPAEFPSVTIQLPIYNERYVVRRLIEAAASLDYPAERLQIQVLDDSTDDTTQKAASLVNHYKRKGINISLLHRSQRHGYKAGALTAALSEARGEFIAIFDADFQPTADFLQRTIPHFMSDAQLGMLQTRWGHLNAGDSPLTAAQAIALDKHFAMEQVVRHRANLFPKFNGAAGVWRRQCLEDAGGWQDDTVCEDLCLSTRAILKGWRFRFLNDVVAPAELPTTITAYKSQQARWAQGSIQCFLKFGSAILADERHSWLARLYALFSMSAYITHILLLLLLLLQIPLLYFNYHFSPLMSFFTLAGLSQPLLFILGQQTLYPDWRRRLRHLPTLLLVAVGIAPSSSRAILHAIISYYFCKPLTFVRTPKQGSSKSTAPVTQYLLPFDWIVFVELFFALYAALGLILALSRHSLGFLLPLGTCFFGFSYVCYLVVREKRG